MSVVTEIDQAVEEIRRADRLLLLTHENPDGDALGSLLGFHELVRGLGKDSLMFMPPDAAPLPHEYRFLDLDEAVSHPPADLPERLVVFLDCGNLDRMPVDFIGGAGTAILNVDHHHDNTRFGTVNLVMARASCTAEIVFTLGKELGAELTPRMAEALYVGLVTDTGRFMYENTTPEAHRMAAELIEAGVAHDAIYRRLYEELPYRRLALLGRALQRVERYDGGLITMTHLTREDFLDTGADETDAEGVVDRIRAVEGTRLAAFVRELLPQDRRGQRKVSLRASADEVDVSQIARRFGGGGHRQAAGFTTSLSVPELVDGLRRELIDQL